MARRRRSRSRPKRPRRRRGRTIKRVNWLIGRPKSRSRDKRLRALPPGKRISSTGKIYYEYRANHADLRPSKGL